MLREECRIGQKVYFGRPNGQQTLGEIVKLNLTKAKVKTLQQRGRSHAAGVEWGVPYSMLRPAEGEAKQPLTYNRFASEDNLILQAIAQCYSHLSPENLTCDGEASRDHVVRRGAELQRKLKYLQLALGREVGETQAYEWDEERRKTSNDD